MYVLQHVKIVLRKNCGFVRVYIHGAKEPFVKIVPGDDDVRRTKIAAIIAGWFTNESQDAVIRQHQVHQSLVGFLTRTVQPEILTSLPDASN